MIENIIKELVIETKEKNLTLKEILNTLFENQDLKNSYTSEVRKSTIIGKIANKVMKKSKIKQECKIMAIGDIKYFGKEKKKWSKLVKKSMKSIDASELVGYDLSSQGSYEFRESIYNYMNNYYSYSELDKEKIVDSIIPTNGCTDGFVTLIDTLKSNYRKIKFIYPEASFLSNVKIAEQILGKRNTIKVNKPKPSNFFFSDEQIDELYSGKISQENTNIYYITPVGNPTGEKISDYIFLKILRKILAHDENAIFILDNVYVGLLKQEVSIKMFKNIFGTKKILDRIVFADSLSKTMGTTGMRIGWLWTSNELFSSELKKNTILKKAGFSKISEQFTVNLLSKNKKILKFQSNVFKFWSKQREKFYSFVKENYIGLFNFTGSCKHSNREGLYLLLKVKDGYSKEEVFAETGIIGVGVELSDGLYIRYAFGNVNYF